MLAGGNGAFSMEIRGRCWGGRAVEELDTTWPPLLLRWGNFRFLCSPSPGAHSSPAPCCRIDQDDLEGLIGPRDEIPAGGGSRTEKERCCCCCCTDGGKSLYAFNVKAAIKYKGSCTICLFVYFFYVYICFF